MWRAEADDLDADIWLLNCQNGTLDLRDRRHCGRTAQADLITKLCGTFYDPDARLPAMGEFPRRDLRRGRGDDPVRAVRAGLFADRRDCGKMCSLSCTAPARTVNQNCWRRWQHVLGDYMMSTARRHLGGETRREPPANDVAALPGARLGVDDGNRKEPQPAGRGLVKQVTGGDKISARKLSS